MSEMNDALAKIVADHPTRFAGLGTLAPQEPDAPAQEVKRIQEVKHTIGPLGVGGV